jgi:hypothetical protein
MIAARVLVLSWLQACSGSHTIEPRAGDAGLDAQVEWPPACGAPGVAPGVATGWVSAWDVHGGWFETIDGDGFYLVDRTHGAETHVIERLDRWGGWSAASVPRERDLPQARLLAYPGGPRLVRWGNARLTAHSHPRGTLLWNAAIEPGVQDVGALDDGASLVISDSADPPVSFEIYASDGRRVSDRTPFEVDGSARLHAGVEGRPMVSVFENGRYWAGDEARGLELLSASGECARHASDLLPLGDGSFVWAWDCGDATFVELHHRAAAPVRVALPSPADELALGGGPDGTIVLALSTATRIELRVFDRSDLAEVAAGELAPDGATLYGSGFAPAHPVVSELGRTSVDGVFAMRVNGDIPDGTLERWALGLVCAR